MTSVVLLPEEHGPPPVPPGPGPVPFPGEAVTLAGLERALGVRVGPFADLTVQQGLAPAQFQVDALRSSAETAGWENLFVLRRGVYGAGAVFPAVPGEPVPGFVPGDRTRLVKSFAAESGGVEVDRDYGQAPVPGERVELHVLHPEWELRRAALDGLERVFRFGRIPLVPPAPALEVPLGALTEAYPWLTDRSMVYGVEYGPLSDPVAAEGVSAGNPYGVLGLPLRGWDALQGDGGVVLQLPWGNNEAAARGSRRPRCGCWCGARGGRSSTGRTGCPGTSGRTTTCWTCPCPTPRGGPRRGLAGGPAAADPGREHGDGPDGERLRAGAHPADGALVPARRAPAGGPLPRPRAVALARRGGSGPHWSSRDGGGNGWIANG